MKQDKPLFIPLLDNGNGDVKANFMLCAIEAFANYKIHMIRASDSHAGRGMNKVANAFLDSGCDIWINIDADLHFCAKDIERLLSHNLPLVYGVYPKKQDDTPSCICTLTNDQPLPDENGLVEVRRAGRGFMLVHRDLLERMKEENGGPAVAYHNHEKPEWDFFPSGVVTGEMSAQPEGKREWLSEDWYFCERARALGVKIRADSRIVLAHEGAKVYRFGLGQIAIEQNEVKSWRDIHGWFDYEHLYRDLAKMIPDGGKFAEVGCWMGRSLAALHEFAQEAGKRINLVAVDTFRGEPSNGLQEAVLKQHGGSVEAVFLANMKACGLNGELTVHAMPSLEASRWLKDGTLDAVFIDADHSYEAVRADIEAWRRNVKPGGILAGHDFDEPGVNRAVWESFTPDQVQQVGRCWVVKL